MQNKTEKKQERESAMGKKIMTRMLAGGITCLFLILGSCAEKDRIIKKVESVEVDCPVGTVPQLPYQVWVTYQNGDKEWRQIRWTNSERETENQEAEYPVGKKYTVDGFVLGDNTTENGYPVKANIQVVDIEQSIPDKTPVAHTLPLKDVQLIGDNRLTNNRDLDIQAILSWDITKFLYNYRDTYGLSTEGYATSEGWDNPTTKLKGHGTGHYLSALAFAYASAQDADIRVQLLNRIRRMVNELRECQEKTFVWDDSLGRYWEARDLVPEKELSQLSGNWQSFNQYKKNWKHYGYGYLNAIPAQHPILIEMYRPYNNEEWTWAPYYTIHKQLAGLIDIATQVDDKEIADKALLTAKDMGLWVWNRLHYRTYVKTDGTKEERRKKPGNRYEMWDIYIGGEVGGMAESLARLSEMATQPEEKKHLLEAANYFDAPAFFLPLSKNIDDIRNRHANQHIPMITGALRSFRSNGIPFYYLLAKNFWNLIQGRYMYAMGGVGNMEMFREPYTQSLAMNTNATKDSNGDSIPNPDLNETCCCYNLAKLSKELNCYDPDNAHYMDYYERALYNQIVGSLHPTHYSCTYHYAVGMNAAKAFGNENPQVSCCGGTGAENPVKYQEAVYFVSDNTMWVGLYLPTKALWREKNIEIEQECLWPAEKSTIRITHGHAIFSLKLRVPYWANQGFEIRLNGKTVTKNNLPCSYAEISTREWKEGDEVEIKMPFSKHIFFHPDKMETAVTKQKGIRTFSPQWLGALMYGPLVMATPDVVNWDEAEFDIIPNLSDIELQGASKEVGYNGNLYTLRMQGKNFQPDYFQTGHSTHYLRLNILPSSFSPRKK